MGFNRAAGNINSPQPFAASPSGIVGQQIGAGTGANVTVVSEAIPVANTILLSWTAIVSLNASVSGQPSGTLKLQATNEFPDPGTGGAAPGASGLGGTGWVDLPGSSIAVGTGGAYLGSAASLGAAWVRVVYVSASGNPIIQVWLAGKP